MADSTVALEVEDWIRTNWMSPKFSMAFAKRNVQLTSGGHFEFDAVSDSGKIVASISTSAERTENGRNGSGKAKKLHSDMLFLLMAKDAERRAIVLVESDMYNACLRARKRGRTPPEIEFYLVDIPAELRERLIAARAAASKEVTPVELLTTGRSLKQVGR